MFCENDDKNNRRNSSNLSLGVPNPNTRYFALHVELEFIPSTTL